jgi:lysophospholipase L1-like esterase
MSRRRRFLTAGAVLTALSGLLISGAGQAGAAPDYQNYVALGDSYASGPFIPDQALNPLGCVRSDHNYAGDLARALGVPNFTDVSCGGADSTDMLDPQSVPLGGTNAPQFDALKPDTDLVTVTIGGNDIGFTDILETCAEDSLTNPFGNPCQKAYTAGGTDQLAAKISADAGQIAQVLAGIRQRSPQAKVVVVGYLRILPPSGGCWPVVPLAAGDVPYLNGVQNELNGMLAQQAQAAGDTFVDPSTVPGHDVCRPESTKWVEGLIPTTAAFPFHPNAAGMAAVEGMVAGRLG